MCDVGITRALRMFTPRNPHGGNPATIWMADANRSGRDMLHIFSVVFAVSHPEILQGVALGMSPTLVGLNTRLKRPSLIGRPGLRSMRGGVTDTTGPPSPCPSRLSRVVFTLKGAAMPPGHSRAHLAGRRLALWLPTSRRCCGRGWGRGGRRPGRAFSSWLIFRLLPFAGRFRGG